MGKRQIIIKQSVADAIAEVSWFIESKDLIKTAEKYAENIYDFIEKLADTRKKHPLCRDTERAILGFKCVNFNRKYTVVVLETDQEIIVCEFLPSKMIYW
jgi:hypothetical protein